jgi:hypothetical protein
MVPSIDRRDSGTATLSTGVGGVSDSGTASVIEIMDRCNTDTIKAAFALADRTLPISITDKYGYLAVFADLAKLVLIPV